MTEHLRAARLEPDLPLLVREGVIDSDAAERLRARYRRADGQPGSRSLVLVLLGALGAALLGSGLILLVGHNWDALSLNSRTACAFVPLALALAVAGWVIATGRGAAWREGAGLFWPLAAGASLGVIDQLYQMPGGYEHFLLRALLLALPPVYLLRSVSAAALYVTANAVWAVTGHRVFASELLYWPLLAAVLPFVVWRARARPGFPGTTFLLWVFAISLAFAVPVTFQHTLAWSWLLVLLATFASYVLLDAAWWRSAPSLAHRPFCVIGTAGAAGLVLFASADLPWRHWLPAGRWIDAALSSRPQDIVLVLALLVANAASWLIARRAGGATAVPTALACAPLAAAAAHAIDSFDLSSHLPAIVMNAFVAALGATHLTIGYRRLSLLHANFGMLLLAALVTIRFFDSALEMIHRGLAFIVLGALLVAANAFLHRRRSANA